ncbi:MAG TPA: peptide chain release factor-like protein [Candidatus Paceibacterota bacterium]|nr:peptide chain release factor-like protein [Candidatus Paceibacterota bacterium]
MLSYERNKALLYLHAGAGGVDAQDWTSMLLKMYFKFAQTKGWRFVILNQSFGEQNGTKNAAIELAGDNVYETLRNESGVHRLVRMSPFSAKQLRHTSFAMVEVLPEIVARELNINPNDLRIDTFRSSGAGGQNVNKLETAVRVTHLPTGISVAVQSERSQAQNKDKAMQLLTSRLAQRMEQEKAKELSELKPQTANEWGSQIRSYVLNPYQMVKDHRTGVKSSQPDKVLDGDLDKFITAESELNK